MSVIDLHPQVSEPKVIPAEVDGGYLINVGGIIEIAKNGESPQAKRLYRLFLAEFRALNGQPLSPSEKEQQALFAAFRRMNINLVQE